MQNEFEKQVHQKMEELNLVPSDPVWQKVELQIRRKKDRRRLLLWLPLMVLFLGGGIWFFMNHDVKHNAAGKLSKENLQQKNELTKTQPTIHNETDSKIIINKKKADKTKTHSSENVHANISETAAIATFNKPSIEKKLLIHKKRNSKSDFVENKNFSDQQKNSIVKEGRKDFSSSIINQKKISEADTSSSVLHLNSNLMVNNSSEIKTVVATSKQDSVRADTALQKPQTALKKSAEPKWKYALLVSGGASGLSRLQLFNRQQSFGTAPNYSTGTANSGGTFYDRSSPVKKDWSLSVGIAATKRLSKRTSFSTGVQYRYYSNSILVGNKITQDTVLANFAVRQYYSGNNATLQSYRNQYHFISVPVNIDWQLLQKIPLHLHAGISLQYLIQTNALRFDAATKSYFNNKKAFNSIQLFSELGLSYSVFLKQHVLLFGPQLQYGLTRIEKGNPVYHLFSYGITAEWQWRKK